MTDDVFKKLPPESAKVLRRAEVVARQALERTGPCAVAWTGGKDSTLLLWIVRRACASLGVSLGEVVFIDDGDVFPEIEEFLAVVSAQWEIPLTRIGNWDLLRRAKIGETVEVGLLDDRNRAELAGLGYRNAEFLFEPESFEGSHLTKILPLREYIRGAGARLLFVGIRRDEHPARADELSFAEVADPPHVRAHPLLDLSERDVWNITLALGIPYCSLYAAGYRSLGAQSSTAPTQPGVPAWEQDFSRIGERDGRGVEKERIMEQLRSLGYM